MQRLFRWLAIIVCVFAACAELLLHAGSAAAQHGQPGERAWRLGAQAVGVVTHARPALDGRSMTEWYLTQPAIMAHAGLWGGALTASGTLNFERWTLERGELNAGIWGEGYIDRRHPHTFVHELVATLQGRLLGLDMSVTGGKGFAPFGTDDPMVRPFVKYPANHHLAQILERGVLIAALRRGPLVLEGGLFNGDEPSTPSDFVNWDRFGDSWSARATLLPSAALELSGSYAFVASPEFPAGSGLDHRKWSVAARSETERGYTLVEWARTDEYIGTERTARYSTLLSETAFRSGGTMFALRHERTLRPEEERLENRFRSPRPHSDVHVLGATRWNITSVAMSGASGSIRPFVEVGRARVTETLGSLVFDPAEFYGSSRLWSLSAGVRVEAGRVHRRMGRYGVAAPGPADSHSHH